MVLHPQGVNSHVDSNNFQMCISSPDLSPEIPTCVASSLPPQPLHIQQEQNQTHLFPKFPFHSPVFYLAWWNHYPSVSNCEWPDILPYFKLGKLAMPATVSWMLAEDSSLLGQRQRTFLGHSQRHKLYDRIGSSALQLPQRLHRLIQVGAVHTLGLNRCGGKRSSGTVAASKLVQPVLQRETFCYFPGQSRHLLFALEED